MRKRLKGLNMVSTLGGDLDLSEQEVSLLQW
jgi:hypothetical protein